MLIGFLPLLFVLNSAWSMDITNVVPSPEGGSLGYIGPNEDSYLNFQNILLERTGVLIGLGSFRVFQAASQGNFDHVICFDHSEKVRAFNLEIVELLKSSQDRIDFLMSLLGRKEFRNHFQAFERSSMKQEELKGIVERILRAARDVNVPEFNRNFLKSHLWFVTKVLGQYYFREDERYNSFLRSDEKFRRIRELALTNRIHVIRGDISNLTTMRSLAEELRRSGDRVSVLDLSNAYDYVNDAGKTYEFLRSLGGLPFSEDGLVLFTARKSLGIDWLYFGIEPNIYLSKLENPYLRRSLFADMKYYPEFYRQLEGSKNQLSDYDVYRKWKCGRLFKLSL